MSKTTDTRSQILDVAQDLIQRRGLNAMSFQDLSDAVGIKKASVHYHFRSKDSMVTALLERFLVDFDGAVQGILNSRGSGKTKLKRYCGMFVETLETSGSEKNCLCGMLIAEIHSLDEDGVNLAQRFVKGNVGYIRQIIRMGVQDGSLSSKSESAGTAELVLSTIEGGLLLARCEGGPKRLATVVSRLMTLLSSS